MGIETSDLKNKIFILVTAGGVGYGWICYNQLEKDEVDLMDSFTYLGSEIKSLK